MQGGDLRGGLAVDHRVLARRGRAAVRRRPDHLLEVAVREVAAVVRDFLLVVGDLRALALELLRLRWRAHASSFRVTELRRSAMLNQSPLWVTSSMLTTACLLPPCRPPVRGPGATRSACSRALQRSVLQVARGRHVTLAGSRLRDRLLRDPDLLRQLFLRHTRVDSCLTDALRRAPKSDGLFRGGHYHRPPRCRHALAGTTGKCPKFRNRRWKSPDNPSR